MGILIIGYAGAAIIFFIFWLLGHPLRKKDTFALIGTFIAIIIAIFSSVIGGLISIN